MHAPTHRSFTSVLVAFVIVALALASVPGSALADGDPASDVLVTQQLFLPWDAGLTSRDQAEIGASLKAAGREGYPLRVALIASASDLGSVSALWDEPQGYADFLGEELSLVYRGTLLVVMPDGFGLHRPNGPLATARSALAGVRPASAGGSALLR